MDYFKNSPDDATTMAATTQQSLLLQQIPDYEKFVTTENDVENGDYKEWQRSSRFKLLRFTSSFYCHTFREPSISLVFSDSSYVYVYDLNSYYKTFLRPFSSFLFYDSSINNSSLIATNHNAICTCYILSDAAHITRMKVLIHLRRCIMWRQAATKIIAVYLPYDKCKRCSLVEFSASSFS